MAIAIPALAAANVYVQMNVPIEPPSSRERSILHRRPRSRSTTTGSDLDAGDNPFRELETSNPEEFRRHVENGRQVYYRNCVFCHGDNLGATACSRTG